MRYIFIFAGYILMSCATPVWAAPSLPFGHATLEDRENWFKLVGWPKQQCEDQFRKIAGDQLGQNGLDIHPLGGGRSVLIIMCNQGDFYQGTVFAIYDAKNRSAKMLKFNAFKTKGSTAKTEGYSLINATDVFFDTEKQVLEIAAQPDGCDLLLVRYRFKGDHPVLISTSKKTCDEAYETNEAKSQTGNFLTDALNGLAREVLRDTRSIPSRQRPPLQLDKKKIDSEHQTVGQ